MTPKVAKQVEALADMTVAELRERYAETFGKQTRARHKDFLRKRITRRLQANGEGDLSEPVLRRAEELAKDSALCLTTTPKHLVAIRSRQWVALCQRPAAENPTVCYRGTTQHGRFGTAPTYPYPARGSRPRPSTYRDREVFGVQIGHLPPARSPAFRAF